MNKTLESFKNNPKTSAWIRAMRLRTMPLSLSGLFLGSSLAAVEGFFSFPIFFFTVITGVLLQTLSDFSNDLGDANNDVDGATRVGPKRTVSSGEISQKEMKKGIMIVIGLIALAALILFSLAFGSNVMQWFSFALLALASVLAAMFYTLGKKPYGYNAKGDYFVFVFFGLVAVLGSYYLFTDTLTNAPLLPAISAGLFSTAVLNINNTRDMKGDILNGKITIASKLGEKGARVYQLALVGLGVYTWLIYFYQEIGFVGMPLIIFAAPLMYSTYTVFTSLESAVLDKQLKITALSTSFFHILMAILLPIIL